MKKRYLIILGIVLLLVEVAFVSISYMRDDTGEVPYDYVAVFKGETGEIVHSTYVYKTKKKKKTVYKYVNTVSTLNGYDSTSWNEKVTKKGTLKKKKKIYKIAKKNEATDIAEYLENLMYPVSVEVSDDSDSTDKEIENNVTKSNSNEDSNSEKNTETSTESA